MIELKVCRDTRTDYILCEKKTSDRTKLGEPNLHAGLVGRGTVLNSKNLFFSASSTGLHPFNASVTF